MVQYPICPKCTNTGLSIIDIEVDSQKLKGVQYNNCGEILWIYQDMKISIEELENRIDDRESNIRDIEENFDSVRRKCH